MATSRRGKVPKIIAETGLSRAQVARDAGLSRATIESWVSGKRTPTPESLVQLAAGLRRRAAKLEELAAQLERTR